MLEDSVPIGIYEECEKYNRSMPIVSSIPSPQLAKNIPDDLHLKDLLIIYIFT